MNSGFSDEHLNAYLDNQLDAEERSLLLEELRRDQELAARVCKLQKVQDMVQLAYHNVASEQSTARGRRRWQLYFAQAASVMLTLGLGLAIGWFSHGTLERPASLFELAQSAQIAAEPQPNDEMKLMLHVNSDDPARLKTVLEEAEYLLRTSRNKQRKLRIEIMANGEGLKLVQRSSNSPYEEKVENLTRDFQNVRFMACRIALNRYEQEKGVQLELLPGVDIVPSAMQAALLRQREGWTYLRI
ncbi:MAG: hypothetical protein PVF21_01400 [Thiohalophilus sp.]|jgi:intracellular sulfur oxidation DsrE/DsrF family protein